MEKTMTDYILIEKIWQDIFCYQVNITCAANHIIASNDVYITDDSIDALFCGLSNFIKNHSEDFFWQNGEKGDSSTACISLKFMQKNDLGHILIEVYMELDDGGNYSRHNCCFFVNTELGLLESFCKKLPNLKKERLGVKIQLNDIP